MIQSLLKAANKQQQGQPGGRNSMHPGYTSGTTRNRRTPARSSSWKDCFRREKVAGMIFSIFIFSGQVQNGRPLPKTGRSGWSSRICFSPMTIYFFLEDRLKWPPGLVWDCSALTQLIFRNQHFWVGFPKNNNVEVIWGHKKWCDFSQKGDFNKS